MTNQEWLQQNNAKIQALQDKLNSKMIGYNVDEEVTEQEALISALQAQVDEIPSIDVESADATESDVLAGKTFYSGNTELKTGTLTLGTLTVNENGTYNASDKGVAGWTSITVDVGGTGPINQIEIALPSIFATASNIYYVQISDDKFLFSSNASNCGLWSDLS